MENGPEQTVDDSIYTKRRINGKLWLPPRGNLNGRLMLILSHPGKEDLETGNLLSGPYQLELQNAIGEAGIHPDDVYVTTMVKYGIGSKPKPLAEDIEACSSILDYEIEKLKPKLIMTLGAEVFKRVMKTIRKQGDSLGEIVDSPYGKLLANYSPGMILNQDPKKRPIFRDIFHYAKRFLDDNLTYTPFSYIIVDDPAMNAYLIAQAIEKRMFNVGYDAEWKVAKFMEDEVLSTFQYSCEPHVAVVLDISKDNISENRELLDTMKPLLEHPEVVRLGWNIRADDRRLTFRGFQLSEKTLGFDGMKACAFFDSRYGNILD